MDVNIRIDAKKEWADREEAFDRTIERKGGFEKHSDGRATIALSYFREVAAGTERLDEHRVEKFVSDGADLNAKDQYGRTALDYVFDLIGRYKVARSERTGPYMGVSYDQELDPLTCAYEAAHILVKGGAAANAMQKFDVEANMLFVKHDDTWYGNSNESELMKRLNGLGVVASQAARIAVAGVAIGSVLLLPEAALLGFGLYVLVPLSYAAPASALLGLGWLGEAEGQVLYLIGMNGLMSRR